MFIVYYRQVDIVLSQPMEIHNMIAVSYTHLKVIAVSLPYRPLEDLERRFVSLVRCAVATCLARCV